MNDWKATNPHHPSLDYPCVQVAALPDFWNQMRAEQSVIIPDVFSAPGSLANDYRENMGEHLYSTDLANVRSWMAVPLMHKDEVLGYMGIASTESNYFQAKHVRLSRAFAEQAAVTVENARLYEKARELAVLDERQRVARDLHDSVAQAL